MHSSISDGIMAVVGGDIQPMLLVEGSSLKMGRLRYSRGRSCSYRKDKQRDRQGLSPTAHWAALLLSWTNHLEAEATIVRLIETPPCHCLWYVSVRANRRFFDTFVFSLPPCAGLSWRAFATDEPLESMAPDVTEAWSCFFSAHAEGGP